MKSRDGKSQRREEKKKNKEDQRRESQKKEDPGARKGRKVAKYYFFSNDFVAPEGRKVGLLKRAGAEPSGQMRDDKLHAVVAQSTSASQNVQSTSASEHFLEAAMSNKMHAVVVRSTFPSQNVQKTAASEHFWKLRCRKSARHRAFLLQLHYATTTTAPHRTTSRLQPL